MSEYQYVAFRAIDAAVSAENLEFMRRQSSRAKITAWSFENEYHFGDFRGNAPEMLRRGYDLHLHFADFGIRKLMIRFPHGLPDIKLAQPYFEKDSLDFLKDKQGSGGTLLINPFYNPGDMDDLLELEGLVDRLLTLRSEIFEGDLRPLYLAHLAVACDGDHDSEEENDAPVPAGLDALTAAQRALAKFYNLSEGLIAAAARNSPPLAKQVDSEIQITTWLQRQPDETKNLWLARLISDPRSSVRSEILAVYQKSNTTPTWPTIHLDRTIAEIKAAADEIRDKNDREHAETAARQRAKRLADMAANPARTVAETEKLVEQRNLYAYEKIAQLLADLREALSGTDRSTLPEEYARKLKERNPTLHHLTSQLRRQGFLK